MLFSLQSRSRVEGTARPALGRARGRGSANIGKPRARGQRPHDRPNCQDHTLPPPEAAPTGGRLRCPPEPDRPHRDLAGEAEARTAATAASRSHPTSDRQTPETGLGRPRRSGRLRCVRALAGTSSHRCPAPLGLVHPLVCLTDKLVEGLRRPRIVPGESQRDGELPRH